MPGQGRLGDKAHVDADAHGCPGCPHPATGPAMSGSPDVFVNGRPAVRADDVGLHAPCCGPNMWQASQGSPTVFINGKPAFRKNDQSRHCGGNGGGNGTPPHSDLPPGDLTVSVVASNDGHGIAGASVQVSGVGTGSGTTDSSGQVTISGLPPGTYQIAVTAGGFANGTGQGSVQSSATTGATVQLTPTTGSLAVTVLDSSTSTPVAAAIVSLSGASTASAVADSQSVARFSGLPAGAYQIVASATGFQNGSGTATVAAGASAQATVSLAPVVGDLIVNVSDQNGTPVARAQVSGSGPTAASGTTNGTGSVTLTQLRAGSYSLQVSATGFVTQTVSATVAASSTVVNVQLAPLVGNLQLAVIDGVTNHPIAGAIVQLSGASSATQTTDANGVAAFRDMPNGPYTIRTTAGRYADGNGQVTVPASGSTSATVQMLGAATIEVLDAAGNVTSFVRFGLWENAFDATHTPFNDEAEVNNFVGADARRFSFRVNDPSAAAQVSINWRGVFSGGTPFTDTPTSQALTLLETSAGSGVFVSKAVMIVNNHEDVQVQTHSGLPAGNPDAGLRSFNQSNHRLRRTDMFGGIIAEYTPARRTMVTTNQVPVFRRTPDERRNAPLLIMVMRVAVGGAGVVSTGATDTIWTRDFRIIREQYERLGIWIWTDIPASLPTATTFSDGNGNSGALVDPPAGMNPMAITGANQLALGATYQANANTMRLMYVGSLASGSRGETIELIDHPTPATAAGASYINSGVSATAPYSPAHELGHQLTDKPFPNDHYRQPTGSPRLLAANNLMRGGGTSSAEAFSASKRLWDAADLDGLNQFTAIRGSTFTRS